MIPRLYECEIMVVSDEGVVFMREPLLVLRSSKKLDDFPSGIRLFGNNDKEALGWKNGGVNAEAHPTLTIRSTQATLPFFSDTIFVRDMFGTLRNCVMKRKIDIAIEPVLFFGNF